MNKMLTVISSFLILIIILVILCFKLQSLYNDNAVLKASNLTLVQTNEDNIKAANDLKELAAKVDKLAIGLDAMAKNVDDNTSKTIQSIKALRTKGGEYEILNKNFPNDPTIICVLQPTNSICSQGKSSTNKDSKTTNDSKVQ